jgi:hypothetical protein
MGTPQETVSTTGISATEGVCPRWVDHQNNKLVFWTAFSGRKSTILKNSVLLQVLLTDCTINSLYRACNPQELKCCCR